MKVETVPLRARFMAALAATPAGGGVGLASVSGANSLSSRLSPEDPAKLPSSLLGRLLGHKIVGHYVALIVSRWVQGPKSHAPSPRNASSR